MNDYGCGHELQIRAIGIPIANPDQYAIKNYEE